jgi:hypothetical protein
MEPLDGGEVLIQITSVSEKIRMFAYEDGRWIFFE